jgi:citrate synthase
MAKKDTNKIDEQGKDVLDMSSDVNYLESVYMKWDGKVVDEASAKDFFTDLCAEPFKILNPTEDLEEAFISEDMNAYFDIQLAKAYAFEKGKSLFTIKIK